MNLAETCRNVQVGLAALQTDLLNPDSRQLETCESELKQMARTLVAWISGAGPVTEGDQAALRSLRQALGRFKAQVELGSQLCSGWSQIHSQGGYTERGQPALASVEASASYEA